MTASLEDLGDASEEYSRDASPAAKRDRRCAWCRGPIPTGARPESIYCSKGHRQAAWRFRRVIQEATRAEVPLRLAYADPPYPGLSRRYYQDHPDYAGEVDLDQLLSRLHGYDGWALSTSSLALPEVLARCVAQDLQVRVAAWVRGARTHRSSGPVQSWEPVIYVPARCLVVDGAPEDSLVHSVRARTTDPRRVIGAKPATFCSWLFGLLEARSGDSLDDFFSGSGGVLRAWDVFQGASPRGERDVSPPGGSDPSLADEGDASRLERVDASVFAGETRRVDLTR